jgi:hypothetical protein
MAAAWAITAALDDLHRAGAVRQHRQHLGRVDLVGLWHADQDLDHHVVARLAERRRDGERVVPQRVTQGAHRGLRVVAAPYVGAHADLEGNLLQRHDNLLFRASRGRP